MLRTLSSVNQLISAEVDSGIDPGRIVIGGFSQGAAISLLTGLTSERKLAGVVSLSGWVVLRNKMKAVGWLHGFVNTLLHNHSRCVARTRRRYQSFGVMALLTPLSRSPLVVLQWNF